ncbi:TPA: DUF444 family protein, partial [Candidatus Woesearchaeota archaeon]|nr:DUF444 family protein [Candidatus Woesearchaeota archaeon]
MYRIGRDVNRFKEIVKGRVRENLGRYISRQDIIGRKGKDKVSIPIYDLQIPRFTYGSRDKGGVGQGSGDPGDPLGEGDPQSGDGEAGDGSGENVLETELTIDELVEIMGEGLGLPNIQPKSNRKIQSENWKYRGIAPQGPESLRNFRRSYKEALKRQVCSGSYNPQRPVIIVEKPDKRYRIAKNVPQPQTAAVIINMMDVSGSMSEKKKELVRINSFWLESWLRKEYKDNLDIVHIIHHGKALRVDEDTYYRTHESGGTVISSAYQLALDIIASEYPPDQWNIYPFHYSDGDNFNHDRTRAIYKLGELLELSNMFGYVQVGAGSMHGKHLADMTEMFEDELAKEDSKLRIAEIESRSDILLA